MATSAISKSNSLYSLICQLVCFGIVPLGGTREQICLSWYVMFIGVGDSIIRFGVMMIHS
jgi:hypothetical protein